MMKFECFVKFLGHASATKGLTTSRLMHFNESIAAGTGRLSKSGSNFSDAQLMISVVYRDFVTVT
jgi:hypothetical protein